jgi:hypothetical protein
MLGSTKSLFPWLAQTQQVVSRQCDHLLCVFRERDGPPRLVVLLGMIVLCHLVVQGARPKSAF